MKTLRRILIAILPAIVIASSSVVFGQNRERFGISAKAGGVNAVIGRVMVTRKEQEPQLLASTDDLTADEVVTTGSASNAEILLNPGSYMRLDENSEFQFEDIALDHLRLRLGKGSAIIEATGLADMDLGISISTPQGTFSIIRSGIYRINVDSESSELMVRKGRASFGPNPTDVLKGGNTVRLTKGAAEFGKVPKEKDALELWSKQRAQLLARANEKLSNRTLNTYLSNSRGWDSWLWGPSRFGLWTFSSRMGCYTFLPFYWGWSSPYGHYYDRFYWRGYGSPNPIISNQSGLSGSPRGSGPAPGSGPGPGPSIGPGSSPGSGPSTHPSPRVDPDGNRIVDKSRDPN